MSSIYAIIKMLQDEPSRLGKEKILKDHDCMSLRRLLSATYNPLVQYHIKKIPAPSGLADEPLELDGIYPILAKLSERQVTGNAAIALLSNTLGRLSDENAELLANVIRRDQRAGISSKTLNKVFGEGFIFTHSVMLAQKQDEKSLSHIKYPRAIAQKKSDAMRINAIYHGSGKVIYMSRNGKIVDANNPELDSQVINTIPNGGVIDGELICRKDGEFLDRKTSNGYANKAIKGTVTDEIKSMFCIEAWDLIPVEALTDGVYNVPYETRFKQLSDNISGDRLLLIESEYVDSYEEAEAVSKRYIEAGMEGIILKNRDGIWQGKRSKDQVKFKAVYEGDFEIIAWEYGDAGKRNEHRLGALVVATKDRKLITHVGTGFSDKDRDEITEEVVGKITTIQYNEIISSEGRDTYKLFLPVYVEIREDKEEANTLEELEGLKL